MLDASETYYAQNYAGIIGLGLHISPIYFLMPGHILSSLNINFFKAPELLCQLLTLMPATLS